MVSFLPIVSRELRVAARRRGTYIARCSAAVAVFLVGAWFFLIMPYAPPAMVAKGLFGILSGASVLFAFMSGVHLTADSLSEEKREGTLGLLFLTELRGYDVVLGKLAATSLSAFYGMLAMLPMLAVPLLIGGVSIFEVLRMSLLAINTMLMSLTAGLFVSSMTRAPRQSSGLTFLLLAGFSVLLPMIGSWVSNASALRTVQHWWMLASPGYAFFHAFDTQYALRPHRYWICMGVVHGLAWLFLAGASRIAPVSWKDKPIGLKLSLRDRVAAWSYGVGIRRAEFRKELLSINPFYWLASRSRSKPAQVWIVLAVLAGLWGWGWAEHKKDWLDPGVFIATAIALNVLLKGWFATECTRQLAEDRHRGALELILSTPLAVADILRGQRLALQRQFLAPILLTLAVYIVFMFATGEQVHNDRERQTLGWVWVLGILMFITDLVAIYWVGICMAVKTKRPNHAPGATAFIVLFLPWILFALSMILVVQSARGAGSDTEMELVVLFFWALTAFGVDAAAIAIARRSVLEDFRKMAMSRGSGKP